MEGGNLSRLLKSFNKSTTINKERGYEGRGGKGKGKGNFFLKKAEII